jgi:hypothetical protein
MFKTGLVAGSQSHPLTMSSLYFILLTQGIYPPFDNPTTAKTVAKTHIEFPQGFICYNDTVTIGWLNVSKDWRGGGWELSASIGNSPTQSNHPDHVATGRRLTGPRGTYLQKTLGHKRDLSSTPFTTPPHKATWPLLLVLRRGSSTKSSKASRTVPAPPVRCCRARRMLPPLP